MIPHSPLRYLLSDKYSLQSYTQGALVDFDCIKAHLFILQRREDHELPDHYHRLNHKRHIDKYETLGDLLTEGLAKLAEPFLELPEGEPRRLYIRHNKINEWQELITYIPPLILISAFLYREHPHYHDRDCFCKTIVPYVADILESNLRYTALLSPFIPSLEHYLEERQGFHDLHIHLNGSTESDVVWQSLLSDIDKSFKDKLSDSRFNAQDKEHLLQEGLSDYGELCEWLHYARRIRDCLAHYLLTGDIEPVADDSGCLIRHMQSGDRGGAEHPLRVLFADSSFNHCTLCLPLEASLLIGIMKAISITKNECIASLLHYYLLIQGVCHRMMVQQKHQFGFQQFQRIADSPFRWMVEEDYKARFFQLHGNECRYMSIIEGRFAPKKSLVENRIFLRHIDKGWKDFISTLEDPKPQLYLITHFIKRPDKEKIDLRHSDLRKEIWLKAQALAKTIECESELCSKLVGADAAASEFDTPPDVFAPMFRYLRKQGLQHFTYHAGEDFYHIFGGLRAIYEAVEFCDLQAGNRIGHGVAMGINPEHWANAVSHQGREKKEILMPQGDYLDDLTFLYNLLLENQDHSLYKRLVDLEHHILELYQRIYKKFTPLYLIIQAWKLRKYCPLHLLELRQKHLKVSKEKCEGKKVNACCDSIEWLKQELYYQDSEIDYIKKDPTTECKRTISCLNRYHQYKYREQYDEVITVDVFEIFCPAEIEKLQRLVLKHLHKREIVIEALPTSNIRIGHYNNYSSYHLWIWHQWRKNGKCIPPIVLGTDDAGIFATNIFNEYANIYTYLTQNCKMGSQDAISILKELDETASVYQFRPKR